MENVPIFIQSFKNMRKPPVVFLGRQFIFEMDEGSAAACFS